jgi:hypothetical protein
VTKSSNHTLSLHRLTSNSSITTNFPWLSPTDNSFVLLVPYCTPTAFIPVLHLIYHWITYIASRQTNRKHRFLYCCEGMFTAPLPSNRYIRCRGNVFNDPFPSRGSIRHNVNNGLTDMNDIYVFEKCLEAFKIWRWTKKYLGIQKFNSDLSHTDTSNETSNISNGNRVPTA